MVSKKTAAPKPVHPAQLYSSPMKSIIGVRFDDDQLAAISKACKKYQCSPTALIREVIVAKVAPSLGVGVKGIKGAKEGTIGEGAVTLPVRFTEAQAKAVREFCSRNDIAPGTFLREIVLRFVGAKQLGSARLEELLK